MKKNVLLPFDDRPIPVYYHRMAFPMGIIQANATQDITPWLCGKYINLSYFRSDDMATLNLWEPDNWARGDHILSSYLIDLMKDVYDALELDMIFMFRCSLDEGKYIHGMYNEEYIPGKSSYQKKYWPHDYLLIGYDDEKQVFHSVGYLQDSKFGRYEIPYECMDAALKTLQNKTLFVNFWTYNSNATYKLNVERVKMHLQQYLNSHIAGQTKSENRAYGLEAVERFGEFLEWSVENGKYVDFRYTRCLMEHKYFMQMRLAYFLKNRCGVTERDLDMARKVYHLSERIHMQSLKHMMTRKQSCIKGIADLTRSICALEREYLPHLLEVLYQT